jgi:3-phenylpropionate/trans-cinnamate dioxygenase ferredoxin subunit
MTGAVASRPLGRVEDFPPHRWTLVEVDGRELGVFNTGERFYCVRNKCPHEGAPLCVRELTGTMLPSAPRTFEWGLEDRVLTCPWHGWQFDVESGEMVFGTGARRLTTYELEVSDGVLLLGEPRRAAQ